MKYLITLLLFIFSFQFNLSQNQTIESNLEGLVLEIGDSFTPESFVRTSDGTQRDCQAIIYYNKKGVFNVGGSIVQDPSTGKIIANEPGEHEVVAVCVDSRNNGNRLSQTFLVTVKFTKTKSILLDIENETFTGNYIPYSYSTITENGLKRNDLIVNVTSSSPEIINVESNNLLKASNKGEANITFEVDGVKMTKKVKVKNNPVSSLNIRISETSIRTGDVVNIETKMYDKKGKKIEGLAPVFSFHGESFDGSNSASGLIKNNKFVADVAGLYTVNASFGNITSSTKIKVTDRDVKKNIARSNRN